MTQEEGGGGGEKFLPPPDDDDSETRSRDGEARRSKSRQRLLALGSVFAVLSFNRDDDDDDDDDD